MSSSFVIILLAVLLYGLVHSLLASHSAKALARRLFGPGADRIYRLGYNIFAVFSLLPVFGLVGLLPDRTLYRIPAPWVYLTTLLQGLAVLLLVLGLLQTGVWSFLGVRQLLGPPEREAAELVVSGLYRWMRHPLYSAGLLFIWLVPLMTVNLLALNLGLSAYIVGGAWFEERKLRQSFGEAYAAYQRTTPMLVPGLRRNRQE